MELVELIGWMALGFVPRYAALEVGTRKLAKSRGSNPRLKGNRWEIKDSELNAELKSGAVLLSYSSTDPSEPVV
jgi:hypothetical protein